MNEFKDFLRENNFFARALTFGMIPLFFRISISIGMWWAQGDPAKSIKLFGIVGILIGAFVGHQLYYRWIFPEKRKSEEAS